MRFALMNAKLFLIQIVSRYEFMKTKNTPAKPVFNSKKFVSQCDPIMLKIHSRFFSTNDAPHHHSSDFIVEKLVNYVCIYATKNQRQIEK
ncbi:hypothetical protein B4U80_04197 [Leptotrombidium deliense]|uniref:Uncharacterized protein n=1 Tax=Leptotrombidium deliense TaxID=299467 RepID=A0A443RSK1_9ACAR|nr:hypothetical protein B4U80_04197 [Leptotrombidium deliense]